MYNQSANTPSISEFSETVYRGIAFADAKAAFSMTVAAIGVAGTASFFGSMPDAENRRVALTTSWVLLFLAVGVGSSFAAIFCAALTVLPRRYINPLSERKVTRWYDLGQTLLWNLMSTTRDSSNVNIGAMAKFYATELQEAILTAKTDKPDGAATPEASAETHPQAAEPEKEVVSTELAEPQTALEGWIRECTRETIVRERKYWWVGPSVLFATLGVVAMLLAVIIAVGVINGNLSTKTTALHTITVKLPAQSFDVGLSTP